jgi:hypothetical protein
MTMLFVFCAGAIAGMGSMGKSRNPFAWACATVVVMAIIAAFACAGYMAIGTLA